MSELENQKQGHSARLLIGLGVLWLLLAAANLAYQFVNPTVEVTWETATELETAGFNLYRSQSPTGDFEWINEEEGLIASEGEATSGATYHYIDEDVEAGKTYFYLLEEVEIDQTTNQYEEDILSYQVPYVTGWTAVITVVCLLIGLALLVTGLKDVRGL
jgi:hypothetical protein